MLEQIVNSIIAYLHDQWQFTELYRDSIPEQPVIPSLYAPMVANDHLPISKDGFSTIYDLRFKLFDVSTLAAVTQADKIAQSIRSRKGIIPLRDVAGAEIADNVRATTIKVRPMPDNNAELYLIWEYVYPYN